MDLATRLDGLPINILPQIAFSMDSSAINIGKSSLPHWQHIYNEIKISFVENIQATRGRKSCGFAIKMCAFE